MEAAACARPATGYTYARREPERSALYKTLQEHLLTFEQEWTDKSDGRTLPSFVTDELHDFLGCGILARGFAQLLCKTCHERYAVAWACKGRGFCPSCGGRRMNAGALTLVDHVLPEVPIRQFATGAAKPRGGGVGRAGPRAPNGLTPVVKSRICVASLRCSSVKYVEYFPSSRLGPLATAQFHSVPQTVRCSSDAAFPAEISVGLRRETAGPGLAHLHRHRGVQLSQTPGRSGYCRRRVRRRHCHPARQQ